MTSFPLLEISTTSEPNWKSFGNLSAWELPDLNTRAVLILDNTLLNINKFVYTLSIYLKSNISKNRTVELSYLLNLLLKAGAQLDKLENHEMQERRIV